MSDKKSDKATKKTSEKLLDRHPSANDKKSDSPSKSMKIQLPESSGSAKSTPTKKAVIMADDGHDVHKTPQKSAPPSEHSTPAHVAPASSTASLSPRDPNNAGLSPRGDGSVSPRFHDPSAQPSKGILVKPGSRPRKSVGHVEVSVEDESVPEKEKKAKKYDDKQEEGRFGLVKRKHSFGSLTPAKEKTAGDSRDSGSESPRDPILERRMIHRKSEDEVDKAQVLKKDDGAGSSSPRPKTPSSPRPKGSLSPRKDATISPRKDVPKTPDH